MALLTRRVVLSLLALPPTHLFGQGMATRGARAAPAGKPSGIPFLAHFTDVAAQAGLTSIVVAGHPGRCDYIIETMSCGCAFFDYDDDGWLDILVLSGSRFGDPPPDASNRLYRNNRDGTFTDVTAQAGLFRTGYFYGVTVGDYDNDGHEDLFLTGWPQNALYRNNGNGTFTDVTRSAGLENATPRWGAGCSWLDYDGDGRLDLFVSNYLDFNFERVPRAGETEGCNYKGVLVNCGPRGLAHSYHSLYRNNGDGTFTDVSEKAGIHKVDPGYGLTVACADFDNDGWPDIYVACDSTPSLLFHNNHDGTFTEQGLDTGASLSDDGMLQAGMGVAVGDYNLDGSLDIFKTHFCEDTPVLYENNGKGSFRDVTLRAGLAVETRFISWGAGLADLDNDGNPDLFWVSGSIYPEAEKQIPNLPNKSPRILFRNLGNGRFEQLAGEAGPGVLAPHSSRGCAFGDFDNDGDVDILIVNQNEPPSLLRNDLGGDRHWIKVKLTGVASNRSAIGARVTVRYGGKVQAQEVMAQSSYLSVNDRRLHFGLGAANKADIDVRWPGGRTEKFPEVRAGQLISITEGAGITKMQKF
jgi:enediyne biosynthesis protein E4